MVRVTSSIETTERSPLALLRSSFWNVGWGDGADYVMRMLWMIWNTAENRRKEFSLMGGKDTEYEMTYEIRL